MNENDRTKELMEENDDPFTNEKVPKFVQNLEGMLDKMADRLHIDKEASVDIFN